MSSGRRIGFWSIATFGLLLASLQLVLVIQSWNDPAANAFYWRLAAFFQTLAGVVYVSVGLIVARKRPENVIGWLLGLIGIGTLLYQALAEYAIRGLLVESAPWPAANEAAVLSQTTWVLPFAMIPILLLLYPTGRLISRAWRWVVVAAGSSAFVIVVPLSVVLWSHRSLGAGILNEDSSSIAPSMDGVTTVSLMVLIASVVGALASLVVRWRRSDAIVRLQLKWLILVVVVMVAQGITILAAPELEGPESVIEEVLLQIGLLGMPIAIGLAVLRYRLFEIDRIISRTVTYGLLTAVLALIYLGLVVMLRSLFPVEGSLPVAASTLAVAALFSPLRRQLQGVVARRFNRSGYDADRALSALSGRLREEVDLEPLRDEMTGFAQRTVQPKTLSVWLR